ncbi:hypothetical protein [Nocardia sp. NBC_00511]|uniref:hypothetical protein n=1 Tax=Nocardia sp. NBC_00511 TaxID=2903591 RepID=UPI0030DFFE96
MFEVPGGIFELRSYDDESTDGAGFYLEFQGRRTLDDRSHEEASVKYRPTAIGYLRTDVSGLNQLRDQSQIRSAAECLGYDFADMVIYDPKFGRPPLARLKAQATRLDAEAVIVPAAEHFEGGLIPDTL